MKFGELMLWLAALAGLYLLVHMGIQNWVHAI